MLRPRISLLAAAFAAAVLAPPAVAQSYEDRKAQIDSRISGLRTAIERAQEKEGALASDIEATTSEIGALEEDVAAASAKLAALEADLARHRARLERLTALYREQTRRLLFLRREHGRAQGRLEHRLVQLYETGQIDQVAVLLQAESLSDLIDQVDYFNEIGRQDHEIVLALKRVKEEMRRLRQETAATKKKVAEATAVLAEKTAEQREARAQLVARRDALAAARSDKRSLLASVRSERHEDEEDLGELQAASAQLAATIQAAQAAAAAEAAAASSSGGGSSSGGSGGGGSGGGGSASADSTPSSSGLIWPVSGIVTSGFGYRWGRLHAGIDISAPAGTRVVAAASGSVVYAGSMGGYGNIVVIDHGGGLATAYAHLSAIWTGGGHVSQGQGIGAVGCTGSCTGNHLHFEVRVNGQPVDPLGYL